MPDTASVLQLLSELALALGIFGGALLYATVRGRQTTINAVIGIYLGTLLTLQFAATGLLTNLSGANLTIATAVLFTALSVLSTHITTRLMPDEFREGKFEGLGKKLLAASATTIVLLVVIFQVVPLTDHIPAGTPIQAVFAPAEYVFWWLLGPLALLYAATS